MEIKHRQLRKYINYCYENFISRKIKLHCLSIEKYNKIYETDLLKEGNFEQFNLNAKYVIIAEERYDEDDLERLGEERTWQEVGVVYAGSTKELIIGDNWVGLTITGVRFATVGIELYTSIYDYLMYSLIQEVVNSMQGS